MRSLNSRLLFAGLSPWLLAACTNGVCVDDGFAGNQDKDACAQASATATESNTDTDTDSDSASASASVSVSVTATMGTMTASGSTTASATDTDGTESDSATMGTTSGGVDWCVDGLDRNHAYGGHCRAARP